MDHHQSKTDVHKNYKVWFLSNIAHIYSQLYNDNLVFLPKIL